MAILTAQLEFVTCTASYFGLKIPSHARNKTRIVSMVVNKSRLCQFIDSNGQVHSFRWSSGRSGRLNCAQAFVIFVFLL